MMTGMEHSVCMVRPPGWCPSQLFMRPAAAVCLGDSHKCVSEFNSLECNLLNSFCQWHLFHSHNGKLHLQSVTVQTALHAHDGPWGATESFHKVLEPSGWRAELPRCEPV